MPWVRRSRTSPEGTSGVAGDVVVLLPGRLVKVAAAGVDTHEIHVGGCSIQTSATKDGR